jgi:hypothetical protein
MLAAPVSFIRYPLAILAKSPIIAIPLLLAIVASNAGLISGEALGIGIEDLGESGSGQSMVLELLLGSISGANGQESFSLSEALIDFAGSSLAVVVESALLGRTFLVALLAERNIILAANILAECERVARDRDAGVLPAESDSTPAVVAVLGMAHCNGIQKILLKK